MDERRRHGRGPFGRVLLEGRAAALAVGEIEATANRLRPNGDPTMIDLRVMLASMAVLLALSGCGQSAKSPDSGMAPRTSRADVMVTFDGRRRRCLVALASEAQGSTIACGDVVAFVREELRVPRGALYEVRNTSDVDEAEVAKATADLNSAGYRSIGTSRK